MGRLHNRSTWAYIPQCGKFDVLGEREVFTFIRLNELRKKITYTCYDGLEKSETVLKPVCHCLQHTMGRQNGWNVGQGPAEILLMNVLHLEEVPRQTIIAMLASAIGTNLLHMRYVLL